MSYLETPAGTIKIYFDDHEIEYSAIKLQKLPEAPDITERHRISIDFENDGKPHFIECNLWANLPEGTPEFNGRATGHGFKAGNTKITIALLTSKDDGLNEGESPYSIDFSETGMEYILQPKTHSGKFSFGIAWIANAASAETESQTIYAANPLLD